MGRLLDSLGFQLPQQQVVTSTDAQLYGGESQSIVQQGVQRTKRQQQYADFASQGFQMALRAAKPALAREKREKEQKGFVAGQEAFLGVSGTTYEERRKNLQNAFRDLRKSGEIDLIDDPYFIEGLNRAEGMANIQFFDNYAQEVYDTLKSDPAFYKDPNKFETQIRRAFDSFYVGLPQNAYVQEGFLSKVTPVIENLKSKYRAEANQQHRTEFIANTQAAVGAEAFTYAQVKQLLETSSDEDIRDRFIEFASDFGAGVADGSISLEERKRYLPAEYVEDAEGYFRSIVSDPERMRVVMNNYAYDEMVEGIQGIVDNLYSFDGKGRGGLGVNPTDVLVDTLGKNIRDPYVASQVAHSIKLGTGSFADTEKGKQYLNVIREDAKKQADKEYQAKILPQETLLTSQISNFDIYMKETGQTQQGAMDDLSKQIDELYPPYAYPEQNQRLHLKLFNDVYQAKRRITSQEQQKKDSVLYMLVGDSEGTIEGAFDFPNMALEPDALEIRMEQVGEAQERYRSFTTQVINSQLSNAYIQYTKNPDSEAAQNEFWNSVGLASKANERFGMRTRVHPLFYNKAVLDDPQTLGLLYDAYERGVLNAFVAEDSDIHKIVVESFVPNWNTRPEDVTARSVARSSDALDRKKQEEVFEDALDVNFDRIPITATDPNSKSGVEYITQGQIISTLGIENKTNLDADQMIAPELNRMVADAYLQEYSRKYAETRNVPESIEAAENFVKETFVIDDIGNVDQGIFDANDDIYILTDKRRTTNLSDKIRKMREDEAIDVDELWSQWRSGVERLSNISENQDDMIKDIGRRRLQQQKEDIPIYVKEKLRQEKVFFATDPAAANSYQTTLPRQVLYAHGDFFTEDEGAWLTAVSDRIQEMGLGISPSYSEFMMIAKIMEQEDAKTPPSQRKDDRDPMNQKQWFNWLTSRPIDMYRVFNPREETIRTDQILRQMDAEFDEDPTKLVPESTRNIMEAMKGFEIDLTEFDLESDLVIVPALEDGSYYIMNEDGEYLEYKDKNYGRFVFTEDDILFRKDATKKYTFREAGPILQNSEKTPEELKLKLQKPVSDRLFKGLMHEYVSDLPAGTPRAYFINQYGKDVGDILYKYYADYQKVYR